jgi:hypothetical protein
MASRTDASPQIPHKSGIAAMVPTETPRTNRQGGSVRSTTVDMECEPRRGGFRAEYVPRHAAAAVAVQVRAGSRQVYETGMS